MANLLVSPDQLRSFASTMRGLIDEYNGILNNYVQGTQANLGAGGWNGLAAQNNMHATEEIHQVQTNVATRWGSLIDVTETAASNYENQEQVNAAKQAAVGHG
ncbi:hypothetical protein D2E64_12845 [Mycobacteroides abscessus]|uniref:WXG100 family type VII secretion target n=1 Tax=Mycobacteroides abscessus TaxID=36809 RepID=UPI0002E0F79C|nr:WXG100 family type VII secretion target [Mycobacteroides abscessus]MBN7567179.1 WXG100 family type VII secretion target [Mycobacteroides abscessus subsp. massiliense]PVA72228.1 hypothetical protein DDJ76_22765 [Mycobacteroides abscessus]RIS03900.1 hypothetical protein D2E63_22385 [Mycobacteroides abscessus]RIS11343.1 hypothetical protein D2E69_22425 [Mycobacteroides abscessus]RIS23552.1 hypothetical protein D2E67_22030 [Mycobacteroides abscessus]